MTIFVFMILLAASALLTLGACMLMMPLLQSYALARPNARSSHAVPTPQGGGIAILVAGMAMAGLLVAQGQLEPSRELGALALAALGLGLLGGWDDIRPLPAMLRLVIQALCVAAVILALPPLQLLPWPHAMQAPLWFAALNLALIILAGVWFVNLTNFMDGLDWLTAAGFVPLTVFIAMLGVAQLIAPAPAAIAAILCGALLGFAPLNRPVARLFLGDVGSLPIGLVVSYLLYHLAGSGGLTAAILLPLYHITDATLTLFQRLGRREAVWQAHRSHAYQRATDNGFSVVSVAGHVFGLNLVLCGLALACIMSQSLIVNLAALALGLGLTLLLVRRFTTSLKPVVAR